jgi:hypothetical protein
MVRFFFIAVFLFTSLGFQTGCVKDSAGNDIISDTTVAGIIGSASKLAASVGLRQWAKSDPNKVKLVCDGVVENVNQAVLPYLENSQGLAISVIEITLRQKFAERLDPEIAEIFLDASDILEDYLPASTSSALMTATQIKYLKAFFTGIRDGCVAVQQNPQAVKLSMEKGGSVTVINKSRPRWFAKK